MKQQSSLRLSKIYILFLLLSFTLISCKKTADTPPPATNTTSVTTPNFSGCRISQYSQDVANDPQINLEVVKFNYDKDGFIFFTESIYKRNNNQIGEATWRMIYKNGFLEQYSESRAAHIETYEYTNGVLSAIKIPTSNSPDLVGLVIKISTDANKRIIKMEDNRDGVTVIKRDTKGNITEIKKTEDSIESFRMEITGYDNKKSIYELMKGFQFDSFALAETYMEKPLFSVGASGNPIRAKVYRKGVLREDLEFSYEYTVEGYPTKITSTNLLFNKVLTQTIEYEGCK